MTNRKIKNTILDIVTKNPGKRQHEIKEQVYVTTGKRDMWYTGRCLRDLIKAGSLVEKDNGVYLPETAPQDAVH